MAKRIFRISLIVILLVAIAFFAFVPGIIDRKMNTTVHPGAAPKIAWYDSISFIADMHCDALLWDRNLLKRSSTGHVDILRMQEANEAFQVFTIVSKTPRGMNIDRNSDATDNVALLSFAQLRAPSDWFSLKARALHQCEDLRITAEKSNGTFRLIRSKTDLQKFIADRAQTPRLTAGMLGLEGAHCLEKEVANLDTFFAAGVRYIGLTHFFDNEWGGSAHGWVKGGLTEKGKELLKRLIEKKVIIDLAHASPALIDDILANSTVPLIVSHTGVRGVCDNVRNLTDKHLLEIGKRNGLVCIGLWETAVCGTDAAATARTIRYVADKIGIDKVALGSDFDGAIQASYDITGFPAIVDALIKEGFDRPSIEKIMGGNIRDFLLQNLPD